MRCSSNHIILVSCLLAFIDGFHQPARPALFRERTQVGLSQKERNLWKRQSAVSINDVGEDESTAAGSFPKRTEISLQVSSGVLFPQSNTSVLEFLGENAGFRNDDESVCQEILSVSKEAVATAEAFLSEGVASQLDAFRVFENDTQKEVMVQEILPDSRIVGDDADTVEAPSIAKIIQFAIPATGVWLCSPLLSLIDTSCVGILCGTVQQAALNPAVAVTEYTAHLIAFLYAGTTNLIAAARERDRNVEGSPKTTRKLIGSLQLSAYVGFGMCIILLSLAGPLVRVMLGGEGHGNSLVFQAATRYVRARALGMPAAAMIGTAQAACLGMQDAKSPLYVLLVAAVVNFMGDLVLVGNTNPWIGGAAGAAWATTFSQYVALGLFICWLSYKPPAAATEKKAVALNISNAILEFLKKPIRMKEASRKSPKIPSLAHNLFQYKKGSVQPVSEQIRYKPKEPSFSARGFLAGRVRKRDFFHLPSRAMIQEFSPYVLPVTTTQFGRVSSYVAMSHVISSCMGTIAMAAQQIIIGFFYSFAPIADSLSLTAQSFFPSLEEKSPTVARAAALRKTMINFAKVGIVFGGVLVALISGIPLFSRFSTSDAQVISMISSVIPYLLVVSAVHSFFCGFEGMLLGRKDLTFVGRMYAVWFVVVPYFMLRVKKAALAGRSVGLASVWKVFLMYHLSRFFMWTGRAIIIQRRTEREVKVLDQKHL